MIYNYGLIKQNRDERDFKFSVAVKEELPAKVDLRSHCPPVFDQLSSSSCTSQAGVAAMMMLESSNIMLSRLFLYYNERSLDGNVGEDCGATMRSICKSLQKTGVCEEQYWDFDLDKIIKSPPILAYVKASKHKILEYSSFDNDGIMDDVYQIKYYLAKQSQPVLIGMEVWDSFESPEVAKTGIVPMPNKAKERFNGGHAVLIVGYDSDTDCFIVRNSWSPNWGDKGYFYLPYSFVTERLAFDAWIIKK